MLLVLASTPSERDGTPFRWTLNARGPMGKIGGQGYEQSSLATCQHCPEALAAP
jgi:hypothetical protein